MKWPWVTRKRFDAFVEHYELLDKFYEKNLVLIQKMEKEIRMKDIVIKRWLAN